MRSYLREDAIIANKCPLGRGNSFRADTAYRFRTMYIRRTFPADFLSRCAHCQPKNSPCPVTSKGFQNFLSIGSWRYFSVSWSGLFSCPNVRCKSNLGSRPVWRAARCIFMKQFATIYVYIGDSFDRTDFLGKLSFYHFLLPLCGWTTLINSFFATSSFVTILIDSLSPSAEDSRYNSSYTRKRCRLMNALFANRSWFGIWDRSLGTTEESWRCLRWSKNMWLYEEREREKLFL